MLIGLKLIEFICIIVRVGDVINGYIFQVVRFGFCFKDDGKLVVVADRDGGLFLGGFLIVRFLLQSQKLVIDVGFEQDLKSFDLSVIYVVLESKVIVGFGLVVYSIFQQSFVLGMGWVGVFYIQVVIYNIVYRQF